jgi:hypothetical protein
MLLFGYGNFIDSESIADAEARVGDTIGPVQLKIELLADYSGTGVTVTVTATAADGSGSVNLTATIPSGSAAGDLFFLRWATHDEYPGDPVRWFTDVTDITADGDTAGLEMRVVNDGPSWRSSTGCIVEHHAHSPWASDVLLRWLASAIDIDHAGGMWRALFDTDQSTDIRIQYRDIFRPDWLGPWGELAPSGEASHLTLISHGNYLMLTWQDDDGVHYRYSTDTGYTWRGGFDMPGTNPSMAYDGLLRYFIMPDGDGQIVLTRYAQINGAAVPFSDGENTKVVCTADSASLDYSGNALVVDTGEETWVSTDLGETWVQR